MGLDPSLRPWVSPCVNIFKHEYFVDQQADCNQTLIEAAFGWEKGCKRVCFPWQQIASMGL